VEEEPIAVLSELASQAAAETQKLHSEKPASGGSAGAATA
jgi:hypothetical protein